MDSYLESLEQNDSKKISRAKHVLSFADGLPRRKVKNIFGSLRTWRASRLCGSHLISDFVMHNTAVKYIWLLFFLGWGCSFGPSNLQSRHASDLETRKVRRIAVVVPLAAVEQKAVIPFTAGGGEKKTSEKEAPEMLARMVHSTMAALPRWQIISESEVREIEQLVPERGEQARLAQIGQMVFADAVITGKVQRYRERVGDEWGAKSPASVSFVLELVDVKRGDIIWSARFDETQKALSENIFALGDIGGRGVRWLSAEQLTYEGVKKAVAQLHQILVRDQNT